MTVDIEKLALIDHMRGEDDAETAELRAMFKCAHAYITSHSWCEAIISAHFGFGVGGVIAIFLFQCRLVDGIELLWVVEGDVPSAYLVTDEAPDPAEALEAYAELMDDWIEAVRCGGTGLDRVFPVDAPPDAEHADLLARRVSMIRRDIIPLARDAIAPRPPPA